MGVSSLSTSGMENPQKWNRMSASELPIVATGGTITTDVENTYTYKRHTFNSSGTFTINKEAEVEFLLIAGGGGASNGGGGAVVTSPTPLP